MAITSSTTTPLQPVLEALRDHSRRMRIALSTSRLVYWDERTKMPPAAGEWREQQRAWLAAAVHQELSAPALERLLDQAEQIDAAHPEVRAMRADFERERRIPARWHEAYAIATARARSAWERGRAERDGTELLGELGDVLELARERAHLIGFATEPYDALLGEWEPGQTSVQVERLFGQIIPVARELRASRSPVDRSLLHREFPAAAKAAFERDVVAALGYDLDAGRIDPTPRAFCLWLGPRDVRVTTRFHQGSDIASLTSTMHEIGHALYAQSFDRLGTPDPIAEIAGVGVDESQSRMFENHVGLHPGFRNWCFDRLLVHAPEVVREADRAAWHEAMGGTWTSPLRVGSDELIYDLHVALRFELERDLVNGDLPVADLRDAWNEASVRLLGAAPDDDYTGILQDVHWSIGQLGYFPCYTLGNIYAAQLMQAARTRNPGIDDALGRGETAQLREWMQDHVWSLGCTVTGVELMDQIAGGVDASAHLDHLRARFTTG